MDQTPPFNAGLGRSPGRERGRFGAPPQFGRRYYRRLAVDGVRGLQSVEADEVFEGAVPGGQLVGQELVGAAGVEVDVHFDPGVVGGVEVAAGPAVVAVPLVHPAGVEAAVGGEAGGELDRAAAGGDAIVHIDAEVRAAAVGVHMPHAVCRLDDLGLVAGALQPKGDLVDGQAAGRNIAGVGRAGGQHQRQHGDEHRFHGGFRRPQDQTGVGRLAGVFTLVRFGEG
jgi:hypothetical protein